MIAPLTANIEQDLAWREAELGALKMMCATAPPDSIRRSALLRASVTLLYAHYEGFCKFVMDSYVEALRGSGERLSALKDDLALFALRRKLRELRNQMSTRDAWRFASVEVPLLLAAPAVFEEDCELGSNLWPRILRAACVEVCLPHQELDNHEQRIRSLVSRRNDIAHGEKQFIKTLEDLQRYEDAAFAVMLHLACSAIDIVEQGHFRRPRA